MPGSLDDYESPKRRTFALAVGFAILVALGVATVLIPELQNEPEEESVSSQPEATESDDNDKAPPE